MKTFYTYSIIACIVLFAGCSKDFLKSYDKRIVGTWEITDVNNQGIFGDKDDLPFTSGSVTFFDDGKLTYINSNDTLSGNWNIVKKTVETETTQSLQITAVDFTTQKVLSQYYDDITFTGTNSFNATITTSLTSYITKFRR